MELKYSIEDYENIPGLYREWDKNNPFLLPVFFQKECLINFFYNPIYKCELFSETYGDVSNEKFTIPFGINRNNKVFFWLGDLKELPEKELSLLAPFNIESDHDIVSEFYDAQINANFTDPIKEVNLLLQKNLINKKFGMSVFANSEENIDNVINKSAKYKRIMFSREDDFKRIISELSEEIIESIDKNAILSKVTDGTGLGGIKLFEKYIKDNYKITDNIFNAYYVLYDLRIWADHKDGNIKFNSSLERLELKENSSYEEIYKKLVDELFEANDKLLNL
ncbi:MAG: hypothetical protein WCX30_02665 [Candidatus Paceibacterota bacterium]|jgi:hypothetical protein